MTRFILDIEGINKTQANKLVDSFNSIEKINASIIENKIKFKELSTQIAITLATGVVSSMIAYIILKFFEKEKSIDNEPIIIECQNIKITQGEPQEIIENKIKIIIGNKK